MSPASPGHGPASESPANEQGLDDRLDRRSSRRPNADSADRGWADRTLPQPDRPSDEDAARSIEIEALPAGRKPSPRRNPGACEEAKPPARASPRRIGQTRARAFSGPSPKPARSAPAAPPLPPLMLPTRCWPSSPM